LVCRQGNRRFADHPEAGPAGLEDQADAAETRGGRVSGEVEVKDPQRQARRVKLTWPDAGGEGGEQEEQQKQAGHGWLG